MSEDNKRFTVDEFIKVQRLEQEQGRIAAKDRADAYEAKINSFKEVCDAETHRLFPCPDVGLKSGIVVQYNELLRQNNALACSGLGAKTIRAVVGFLAVAQGFFIGVPAGFLMYLYCMSGHFGMSIASYIVSLVSCVFAQVWLEKGRGPCYHNLLLRRVKKEPAVLQQLAQVSEKLEADSTKLLEHLDKARTSYKFDRKTAKDLQWKMQELARRLERNRDSARLRLETSLWYGQRRLRVH